MAVYIITDHKSLSFNEYKIGRCLSENQDDLLKRYRTYMPNAKIILFQLCANSTFIETSVKRKFADQMVKNDNGNNSEFFQGNISEVISFIIDLLTSQTGQNISPLAVQDPVMAGKSVKPLKEIMIEIVEQILSQYIGNMSKERLINMAVNMWEELTNIRRNLGMKNLDIFDLGYRKVFTNTFLDGINKLANLGYIVESDSRWVDEKQKDESVPTTITSSIKPNEPDLSIMTISADKSLKTWLGTIGLPNHVDVAKILEDNEYETPEQLKGISQYLLIRLGIKDTSMGILVKALDSI